MITMLGSPRLSCDGLTRRETLTAGALSLLGGFFNLRTWVLGLAGSLVVLGIYRLIRGNSRAVRR